MSAIPPGRSAPGSERLIFFSDAVVAIAMTLLALDLPIPEGRSLGALWTDVRHDAGHYFAFLISFAVIASMWSAHHFAFAYAERSDRRLRQLNLLWLLAIVLIPFGARLLTAAGDKSRTTHAVLFGFYALLQIGAGLVFQAMVRHIVSAGLQASDTPVDIVAQTDRETLGLLVGFAASIPLLFLTPYAWVLWLVGPVVTRQVLRRHRRVS